MATLALLVQFVEGTTPSLFNVVWVFFDGILVMTQNKFKILSNTWFKVQPRGIHV